MNEDFKLKRQLLRILSRLIGRYVLARTKNLYLYK